MAMSNTQPEILFWDLGDESNFRPSFNRPPRKGKRWVKVEYTTWVYSQRGEFHPFMKKTYGERFLEVDLPADNPRLEWDL